LEQLRHNTDTMFTFWVFAHLGLAYIILFSIMLSAK